MPRITHTAVVEFTLDPDPGVGTLSVYAAAEQTVQGHPPDFDDPGAPDEYNIHTVEIYDHLSQKWTPIYQSLWESTFGTESWGDLLRLLEGELEEVE